MSTSETFAQAKDSRWLYGRWTDLLVGCGVAYLLSAPLLLYASHVMGIQTWPWILITSFLLLTNVPHYGATIVRVYEQREDRQKYAFFAVYVTAVLAILFAASSRSVWLASALITAYITWSPWHFSGQNYGLAVMFLRRSGVEIESGTKRLLYFSFVLSAALAILVIYSRQGKFVLAPTTVNGPGIPALMHVSIPTWIGNPLIAIVALLYAACLVGAGRELLRRARVTDLVPALILVLTQALWFVVPAIAATQHIDLEKTLIFAAVWISTAHSAQYLWVSAYYAKRSHHTSSTRHFLGKSLLAGGAVGVIPGILFAPGLLGTRPWDAGLAATVFSVVNLHHFILDGAIWKLRDGRVARALIRTADVKESGTALPVRPRKEVLRPLAYVLGAMCLFVPLDQMYETHVRIDHAGNDTARVEQALQHLRWIGRETTQIELHVGEGYAKLGDHYGAIHHFRRSIALFPTSAGWAALGDQYRDIKRWSNALQAYESALKIEPDLVPALFWQARILLGLGSRSGVPDWRDKATASVERVLTLEPGQPAASLVLAQLLTEDGKTQDAIETLQRALPTARGDAAERLRQRLHALQGAGQPSARATAASGTQLD